jgi:hypothetical protein
VSNLSAQAALQEAVELHRQGRLAAAEAAYTRILQDSFDPLHLLGIAKLQTGKAEEALHLITAALSITPHPRNEPDLHASRACVRCAQTPGRGACKLRARARA